jgi:hypothetical protein
MDVGASLLALARTNGARSIAVVGTSKNAGKTVAVAALADALARRGEPFGICSIGRDGEAVDAVDASPKPRLFLRPGAMVATGARLIPRSPALEITALTELPSALGPIVLAHVRAPGYVEISGPPSAHALRHAARLLASDGRLVLIDGAVDRIAALAAGEDAIVVAVGASGMATPARALDEVEGLVARLRLAPLDPERPAVRIEGALTASAAWGYARAEERRQIVVRDPTRVAFGGRAFLELAARIDVRCEQPLCVVACTVAPASSELTFEPRAFARAVAERTGLPAFDVYAGSVAEPSAA